MSEDKKSLLQKIKALFAETPAPEPVTPGPTVEVPEAEVYKLKDGSEISIMQATDVLAIGDMATINGTPAPAADYELEDGTTFTTDDTGALTAVNQPAPATQPEFQAPPVKSVEERLAEIEAELAKMKTPAIPTGMATEAQLATAQVTIDKYGKVIEGLFELTEKMISEPSAEPRTLTGNKKEKFDRANAKEASIDKYSNALKELKKKNQ